MTKNKIQGLNNCMLAVIILRICNHNHKHSLQKNQISLVLGQKNWPKEWIPSVSLIYQPKA